MWWCRSSRLSCGLLSIGFERNDIDSSLCNTQAIVECGPQSAKQSNGELERCDISVVRRRRTRTTKAQRLLQIEPPATVDTTIAQQYQIDDSKHDLQEPDIEEIGWRDRLACPKMHIVGGGGYLLAVTRDQRTQDMLLDRLGKSIPLVPWDAESVWVGRGVLVMMSAYLKIRESWLML